MSVKVTIEKCNGCGDCVESCPSEALKLQDGKVQVNNDECSDCAACIDVCPETALALE
jgi:ferredoxin